LYDYPTNPARNRHIPTRSDRNGWHNGWHNPVARLDHARDWLDQLQVRTTSHLSAGCKLVCTSHEDLPFVFALSVGELMQAQRETVGLNEGQLRRGSELDPRDTKPSLAEAGIDKHLADRARKLAAVSNETPSVDVALRVNTCALWRTLV
jgi:hypothetical protein